jgi:antitoxin (DNA-binding transcriptional repressor) of toxin-antitoxin stability system
VDVVDRLGRQGGLEPGQSLPDVLAGEPVTASLVRTLPVARIVAAAREERFERAGGRFAEAYDSGQDIDVDPGIVDSARAAAEPWAERRPGRPVKLDDSHYREVAQVYSSALAAGKSPLVAIERQWPVTRPTVSRWVAAARSAGLLPPTSRGRARGNGPILPDKPTSERVSR